MTAKSKEKIIGINDLVPGMYVISLINNNNGVKVKTEGYVLNQETIKKITKSGIKKLIVDPSRQKSSESIDRIMPDIESTPLSSRKKSKPVPISLEQEMNKARPLYNNAKSLQGKLLDNIAEGKIIDTVAVKESTDAMVESIFRNQDALSCMSRLRTKDEYLVEHSLNVSIFMTIFAKHLGIDKATIEQLALGAFLHDIGKILIPSEVLNKPGKLTPAEYDIMKNHVKLGADILLEAPNISHIAMSMVQQHHERLDGNGYPKKLSGEDINKFGRMIAIVDSYDAMTAERVYKAGMHPITAFKIMLKESPSSYDEELVEQFVQCLGVYPVGTLVKLNSGKLGLISKLNHRKPLNPCVRVFYNSRLNQAIPMEELDLSHSKHKDQIDRCIKPEEFKINLMKFFNAAFFG